MSTKLASERCSASQRFLKHYKSFLTAKIFLEHALAAYLLLLIVSSLIFYFFHQLLVSPFEFVLHGLQILNLL
jgi:hypothetical protein